MKKVIAQIVELAEYFENNNAPELAQIVNNYIKTAQIRPVTNGNNLTEYKQMIDADVKKATELIEQANKNQISKQSAANQIQAMMNKQKEFKSRNNISSWDEVRLKTNLQQTESQKQKLQPTEFDPFTKLEDRDKYSGETPVFESQEQALDYYRRQHTFRTKQEAEKFKAERQRFLETMRR